MWTPPVLSQAITTPKGRRVYFSGIAGTARDGLLQRPGEMGAQIEQTFRNLRDILDGAGVEPKHIIRLLHIFVAFEVEDLGHLFRAVPAFFPSGHLPTSTGITALSLRIPGQRYELVCDGFVPDA